MNDNILSFPARRKVGRPRLRPMPNVPRADVLAFPSARPTLDQQITDYQGCFEQVVRGLLMAITAVTELHRKYPGT